MLFPRKKVCIASVKIGQFQKCLVPYSLGKPSGGLQEGRVPTEPLNVFYPCKSNQAAITQIKGKK